jgi:AraC-like DNA-binding protein
MRPKPPTFRRAPNANVDAGAANRVPRPVAALANSFPAGHFIAPHRHPRAQLIHGLQGVMTVRAAGAVWTVPASHALWIPPGIEHSVRMDVQVEMRSLYFDHRRVRGTPKDCRVLFVTPLLRELIVRAMEIPPLYDERGRDGRVMKLIVDEIAALRPEPLGLRMPGDARLARACEILLMHLSEKVSIPELGAQVGLSERSVIRLFPRETGLTFGRWQQQARLQKAFALLDEGRSVTQVALELGYAGPSAFTKMFRRAIGDTPTALLQARAG